MIKKVILCWVLTFPCFIHSLRAQSYLQCYTGPKVKANWTIGLRTGISREFNQEFNWRWEDIDSKNRSWTQQLFIRRDIGTHFMLELHSLRQKSWSDLLTTTYHPGRKYSAIVTRNQRLHNNLILYYLFPEVTNRLRTGVGLGLGFLASWQKLEETYTQSGENFQEETTSMSLNTPNLLYALTSSYQLRGHFYLSGQISGSFLLDKELSHLNLNAGVEYRF